MTVNLPAKYSVEDFLLIINNIFDSKRQQTTAVDNKRLFNGLVLTRLASLQHQTTNYGLYYFPVYRPKWLAIH
jgi:hypothetical protein